MIHAYDEIYLDRARTVMAHMLDYAVYDLGYDLTDFFHRFLVSDICQKFERGQANVIAGMSGREIVCYVLKELPGMEENDVERVEMHQSPEYWLGWALAYYQWYSNMHFSDIIEYISVKDLREMYVKYHEMDICHFVERMDQICQKERMMTRLKKYRLLIGLSQKELADKTSIPVRTIQQYEQRQKNINKAQVEYLINFSKALYCEPEDLLEEWG